MRALSVKAKLGLLIVFAIVILFAVGAGGWLGISRMRAALTEIGDSQLPTVSALGEVRAQQFALYAYTLEAGIWEKEQYAQSQFKMILEKKEKTLTKLQAAMKAYSQRPLSPDAAKTWKILEPALKNWLDADGQLNQVIIELGNNDDFAKQPEIFQKYHGLITDWKDAQYAVERNLAKLSDISLKEGDSARAVGAQAGQRAVSAIVIAISFAVLAMLALGFLIARSIVRPLGAMRTAITSIAESNDFTVRVPVTTQDEAGQTAEAFNRLTEKMQVSLREVLDNARMISDAAHQASLAAGQVSDASANQSEAASAMAAAIEEMTVSINHISDATRDALGRARDAGTAANAGAHIINQTNDEMDGIARTVRDAGTTIDQVGEHSERISGIMQVIRDVADQTNLLALNAAIEAARAGEQGRGFAVVADEVRKLAERTSKSTEEIGQRVQAMQASTHEAVTGMESVVRQVDQGKSLSGQASGRIEEIQGSAGQVSNAINEISAALDEQSAVAQDIARQVETVARMSEDNSNAAGETARVATELDRYATALRETANRFKV